MIRIVGRGEDTENLAPAGVIWFVLHTRVGRITALALLLAAVALGLPGWVNASEPLTIGALVLYGAVLPVVLSPLAIREQKRRERR
ncbi:hypothetical protein [Geodermatophilus marinus]|uniref:hypothetical protein n=1 Tax=Geodermatophilus sp. LHW52908 TaxID=2303986 RepID=UPI000E3C7D8A|nr:hypothetical protein [Geodermatophilus sp. LHW52908]RFU18877.1 hypothetical protein D0Z06_24245 [Geodermatophilus sp. LHW52908]